MIKCIYKPPVNTIDPRRQKKVGGEGRQHTQFAPSYQTHQRQETTGPLRLSPDKHIKMVKKRVRDAEVLPEATPADDGSGSDDVCSKKYPALYHTNC